eukprot:810222-Amphidinium_carterae.2
MYSIVWSLLYGKACGEYRADSPELQHEAIERRNCVSPTNFLVHLTAIIGGGLSHCTIATFTTLLPWLRLVSAGNVTPYVLSRGSLTSTSSLGGARWCDLASTSSPAFVLLFSQVAQGMESRLGHS